MVHVIYINFKCQQQQSIGYPNIGEDIFGLYTMFSLWNYLFHIK